MEIKFENISLKEKNKYIVQDLNLILNDNNVIGMYDNNKLLKKILTNEFIEGNITIDKSKKICYIDKYQYLTKTVSDEFFLTKRLTEETKYIEKIISSLNLVGLSEKYLDRKIETLSLSEKTLLNISINLIINPNIIVFDNVFQNLDNKHKNTIKQLIIELHKRYKKMVIVIDDDLNNLYEICSHLIIFKNNKVIINDTMDKAFKNLNIFNENNIQLPFFIEFSDIASNYNKKINYYKNINDLIKEVYKECSK